MIFERYSVAVFAFLSLLVVAVVHGGEPVEDCDLDAKPGGGKNGLNPLVLGLPEIRPFEECCADAVAAGDLNGDGRVDFAAANSAGLIKIFLQQADGGFSQTQSDRLAGTLEAIVICDFDDDSLLDVVAAGDTDLVLLPGHGDGTFADPLTHRVRNGTSDLVVGHFDADEFLDIALLSGSDDAIAVYLDLVDDLGDEVLGEPNNLLAGEGTRSFVAADFNDDQALDFATSNAFSEDVSVFLGHGDGSFNANASE